MTAAIIVMVTAATAFAGTVAVAMWRRRQEARYWEAQAHPPVVVTISLDVSGFVAAMNRVGVSAREAGESMGRALRAAGVSTVDLAQVERDRGLPVYRVQAAHPANQVLADAIRRKRWERELAITRAETSWYVRGGLAPEYATPEARDARVKDLVSAYPAGHPVGARMAAAFLRGWVTHRSETSGECLCWHTPPHMWTTHYGAVEPGSAWEWNPDCPAHPGLVTA